MLIEKYSYQYFSKLENVFEVSNSLCNANTFHVEEGRYK